MGLSYPKPLPNTDNLVELRTCRLCGVEKLLAKFVGVTRGRRSQICSKCHSRRVNERARSKDLSPEQLEKRRVKWREYDEKRREIKREQARQRQREKKKEYLSSWYQRNKNPNVARAKLKQLKAEVLAAYGGKCYCCGETEINFLTLDHPKNDGATHRIANGGNPFYKWLQRNGYPKGVVRVACWNCNCGRHVNGGICPHKTKRKSPNP